MRLDIDAIKTNAAGKWLGIFDMFGVNYPKPVGKHGPCPLCGGTDRARLFNDAPDTGMMICNFCGAIDGIGVLQRHLGIGFNEVMERIAPMLDGIKPEEGKTTNYNPKRMRELYAASRPITINDLAWRYLTDRGLRNMNPPALRFAPKCWEQSTNKELPAMLAIFQGHDGEALTMHRTYLQESGKKAAISNPKQTMTPKGNMNGGAVRLYEFTSGALGIAEGVETAIAVQIIRGIPVWAALNSTLLERFSPPSECDRLEIYADNDLNYTGHAAAYNLARRISLERPTVSVFVYLPEKPGTDFLDEVRAEL